MSDANELSAIAAGVGTAAKTAFAVTGAVLENEDEETCCCIIDTRILDSATAAARAAGRARERVDAHAASRPRHERVVRMALEAVEAAEEAAELAARIAALGDFEWTDIEDDHAFRALALAEQAKQKAGIALRRAERLTAQAAEIEAAAWRSAPSSPSPSR